MSKKSLDYLKEAKAALAVESDYALAKALKTSHVNISNYMNEKSQMDDYHCIKVAQVLGIDPMEIIAAAQEEREKNPEKQEFWRDFRKARSQERGHASVQAIGMLAMTMMGALLAVKWPELIHPSILCQIMGMLRKARKAFAALGYYLSKPI